MMNETMNTKTLRTPEEAAKRQGMWLTIVALVILYAVLFTLDNFVKPSKFTLMLLPVLKKGAIYSLVCVSMNLLNGFTGLFSLGQAGFMLIGAYAYSIFSIPAARHAAVYQYFDGGAIQFSIPEALGNAIGVNLGSFLGAIICIIIAGLAAAVFAALLDKLYTVSKAESRAGFPNLTAREIAATIGYLGHDPELSADTVRSNVLCGSGGVRLSGGQAQRLALARTLAHPRPVLILDDPFSALDRKTEDIVFANLQLCC